MKMLQWVTWLMVFMLGSSVAFGQMRGEFTGGSSESEIDVNDAVYLLAWVQLLQSNDVALVSAQAADIYSGIQGTLTELPTVENADFTGDSIVDVNDVVVMMAWIQTFKARDHEAIEARASELFSSFQGPVANFPGTVIHLNLDTLVSGLSLGTLSVKISGGIDADYSTFNTTTQVGANGSKTLTKSTTASQVAFPQGNGIVLNYSGVDFSKVDDFDTLNFTIPLPEHAQVEVMNGNNVVATATVRTLTVLKLSDLGNQIYKVSLVALQEDQDKKLAGLNNVGILCPSFNKLTGLDGYQPSALGLNGQHSVSLMDLDSSRTVVSDALDLYTFTCASPPSLALGSQLGLSYSQTPPLTGNDKIIAVNL